MSNENIAILQQAESFYNAAIVSENTIGNSANMIFEMTMFETPIILRVSDDSEGKKLHIDFELHWLTYLSKNMQEIVRPILSKNKNLYETIQVYDKKYILCAFEKAQGRIVDIDNPTEWNDTLFNKLGVIMGKMHKMTKQYNVAESICEQFQWNKNYLYSPEIIVTEDDEVQKYWNKSVKELNELPKSKESFGIIHDDIHHHNFFIHNKDITIFDFDDCICSWYVHDIATTLYQAVFTIPYEQSKKRNTFAEKFIVSFLRGYLNHTALGTYWIKKLDLFIKYRRVGSYKFIKKLLENQPDHPHEDLLNRMRNEIILDKPFVEIDYERIITNIKE